MINKNLQNVLIEVRPLPIRYTVDDLEIVPDDSNRYELIEGELFMSHAPHLDHQILTTNLVFRFQLYLQNNKIGIIVPTPGVIFGSGDAVIPDLVFATHETVDMSIGEEGEKFAGKFLFAPDLVIEILSYGKKDIDRDRIHKRELYGKYRVKEYWIVDGMFNTIEVYRLTQDGLDRIKRFEIQESIETPLLPDFSLKLADIFKF